MMFVKGGDWMDIQVVEKEEIKVVGISWNGTYSQTSTIPQLFEEMEARLQEIAYQTNESVLIAPFHSRETEFTYYVTTPVERIDDIPEGMVGFTIPSKNYVFATHRGRPDEVENTYHQMFEWMKEYGYEQDLQALNIEIYKEKDRDLFASGDLHYEIYLPVKSYKR
jgi:AraC family transcriptional regulator